MVFAASPAMASDITSSCPVGGYGTGVDCIFYSEAYNGSHTGVLYGVLNFPVSGSTEYKYLSSGAGQGQYIGNNNGSNRNTNTGYYYRIYYSQNLAGYQVTLSPYGATGYERAGSQLGNLLNNIRSQEIYCTGC
jgi:hypothetical protein